MELAIIATVASAAVGIAGAFQAYDYAEESLALKLEENDLERDIVKNDALRLENDRLRELQLLVGSNIAAAGYDPYSSPSFLAIQAANEEEAYRDISAIQLNEQTQLTALAFDDLDASRQAEDAQSTAILDGIGSVANAGSSLAMLKVSSRKQTGSVQTKQASTSKTTEKA